jgi:cell division protein FtsI (penicillin-binding protein 3)
MSNKKNNIPFSRRSQILWRYFIVSVLILLFAGAIAYNAVKTTIIDADKWNEKANSELSKTLTIMPRRGDILACDGSILATNLTYYTLRMDFSASKFMEKQFRSDLDTLCDTLAAYHHRFTREGWKQYLLEQINRPDSLRSRNCLLLRNITHDECLRVKKYPFFKRSSNPNRTGLTSEAKLRRSYPYGDMARRSVGRVSEREDGSVHGLSGLEFALDSLLYGSPGLSKKVPLTHRIVNWTDVAPVQGYTLMTTIDIAMQDIVENELNAMLTTTSAEWGTAILMDVKTGDIKAISNLERDSLGRYIESMNRAVEGIEPGSVMKTISMVVALEDGFVTNINQVYPIGGSFVYGGGSPIRDSHSPGSLPVSRFLEYSSNIGMTKLVAPHFAKDPNGFRERLRKLGFLDRFNTGIAGERPPYFPILDIRAGGLVSLGRQTYGYASQIPPLYTCAFYNAVANDGKFVRPRLVKMLRTADGDSVLPVTYVRDSICSVKNARIVRQMLHEVVYGQGGTAKGLKSDLVEIAGKTGTSKVAREYKKSDNPNDKSQPRGYIDGSYRLSFCGFFPYENPKYTCMVVISRPSAQYRGAGSTSGMVLKNIALKMYSRGMLGNSSDYTTEEATDKRAPLVHVSLKDPALKDIKEALSVNKVRTVKTSDVQAGKVPDVRGLGIRQAIQKIESAGYNVNVSGTGYVTGIDPPQGTPLAKGGRVSLRLSTNIRTGG